MSRLQITNCVLVAADDATRDKVFALGRKLKMPVVSHGVGAEPSAVVHDGLEYAKARNIQNVVIFASVEADWHNIESSLESVR